MSLADKLAIAQTGISLVTLGATVYVWVFKIGAFVGEMREFKATTQKEIKRLVEAVFPSRYARSAAPRTDRQA